MLEEFPNLETAPCSFEHVPLDDVVTDIVPRKLIQWYCIEINTKYSIFVKAQRDQSRQKKSNVHDENNNDINPQATKQMFGSTYAKKFKTT